MNTAVDLAQRILTLDSLAFFFILMLTSIFFMKVFTSRFQISKFQFLLLAASINVILALTLRWWEWRGTPPTFWLIDKNSWNAVLDLNSNWIFNVLLFIPAGYSLSKYLNKLPAAFLLLTLLSFSIETLQGIFEWGSSDPADWVANTCGASFGVLLAKFQQKRIA